MGAGVQQRSVLRDRLTLDGAKVGERIATRVVVVPVPSHETADVEDRVRIDDAGVGRGDVVGAYLGTLIGIPDIVKHRAGTGSNRQRANPWSLDLSICGVCQNVQPEIGMQAENRAYTRTRSQVGSMPNMVSSCRGR